MTAIEKMGRCPVSRVGCRWQRSLTPRFAQASVRLQRVVRLRALSLDRVRQAPHAEVAALPCCCRAWSDACVDYVFDSCLQVMTTYCTGLRPHMPVCKKAREPLVRFHTVPCCDPRLSWALGLQMCRWIFSPWMGRCEANPRWAQTMGVFGVVWIRLGIRLLQRQPGAPPSA